MSRWAEMFAALSRDVDTSDTSRHIAAATPDVSRSVHSVTRASKSAVAATCSDVEEEHAAIVEQGGQIIAPVRWFEGAADAEPPYQEPWPARRGVIRRRDGRFEHFCATCGAWGAFGYGVAADRSGRWFCFSHRPEAS